MLKSLLRVSRMNSQVISASALQSKSTDVERLMQLLHDDLQRPELTDPRQVEILTQLRVYGRDPKGSDWIYRDEGLSMICKYAFAGRTVSVSHEALRIIANALLLQPAFRAKFAGLGYTESLVAIYQRQNADDEFLGGRILFLLTYQTNTDFATLLEAHKLAEAMKTHLHRHGDHLADGKPLDQLDVMSLSETLKLLFNLANALPAENSRLSRMVPAICTILTHMKIPPKPLEPPMNTVINALAILDFSSSTDAQTSPEDQERHQKAIPKLLQLLGVVVDRYSPEELDTVAIPLSTVIRKMYEVLSLEARAILQKALLPDDSERDLPLGQSNSLASKLLRLTSSPGLGTLPESISAMLFELSDKDASTFVKNIGYGYAAGYLMTHKIPIPENAKQAHTSGSGGQIPVNPITGQRLDKEVASDPIEMTQEEKEREAERLFVLFERLRATGVVDVKNPVQAAMEQGRLQELSDSEPD